MKMKKIICLLKRIVLIVISTLFFLGFFLYFGFVLIKMVCLKDFWDLFYVAPGAPLFACAALIYLMLIIGIPTLFLCAQLSQEIKIIWKDFWKKEEVTDGL